jgi:serine protease Do
MKTLTLAGMFVLALLSTVVIAGQNRPDTYVRPMQDFMVLAGRGAEIGVKIAEGKDGGVVVDEVTSDSPAAKAGLKRSDVIVEFDGERVRSARQFSRLVQETPPGRTVKATIVRDGQRKDVQITPQEGRGAFSGRGMFDGDLRRGLGDLDARRDQLPLGPFNFDLPGTPSGRRLGVTTEELTDQLAQYFGAKEGVLVTAVTDGSAASRAGLKAGDVITSINGQSVRSRNDLVRGLRNASDDEVTIGIVRDKKESSIKARPTLEQPSFR